MAEQYYELRCIKCNSKFDEEVEYTNCLKCGSPLEVQLNYEHLMQRLSVHALKSTPSKATKYADFYPIKDKRKTITLNEGGTPLYHCKNLGKKLGLTNLFIKYEGQNPTGSFKDRGTMVEVTKALELNKKAVVVASSGNMAASVSAYCAKANLPAYVLVPQGTPIGKLAQTLSYGARIIQVRGTYDVCAKLTREISEKHNFYLSGDYAYRLEGQKSQAFEISEQLNWQSPDKVFVPIGCGTNSSAIWKGFKEYKMLDLIENTPQMVGVQADGASPVVRAFEKGMDYVEPMKSPTTVSSAICVGDPLDGLKILKAIKESDGCARSIDDDSTLEAEKLLARTESIFVEPSSATSLAVLQEMIAEGKIDKDEKIVLVLTGMGLKDPVSALKVLYSPPVVEPEFMEVEKYLNYGFYDVVASSATETKILLKKIPEDVELAKLIKSEFKTELSGSDLQICRKLINEFLVKGKEIQKGDLQYILEKSIRLSALEGKEKPLKILDFKVESGRHQKAVGVVKVDYKGHIEEYTSEGVGPVDSVISAIKKAVSSNGFKFRLTDFEVKIAEGGTDASVHAKMTLVDENQNKVIAMGTSPDVIVASVEAFEEGYNLLYFKNHKK
jgi:threonine synthase